MLLGLFLPTGNNGWMSSKNSPRHTPTYALNPRIVRTAEDIGFVYVHGFDDFEVGLDRFGAEVLPLLDFNHTAGEGRACA